MVHPTDPGFGPLQAVLLPKTQGRFPIHAAILVRATAVEAIVAPSYRLYPHETTEASQVASAMHTYGVMPANAPGKEVTP